MRLRLCYVLPLAILLALSLVEFARGTDSSVVLAEGASTKNRVEEVGEAEVTAGGLAGFENPPGPGDSGWENPCEAPAPEPVALPVDADVVDGEPVTVVQTVEETYSEYFTESTGLVMNDVDRVTLTQDGDPVAFELAPRPNGRIDAEWEIITSIDHEFVVEYQQWRTGCRQPESGDRDWGGVNTYWVRVVTEEALVGQVLLRIYERLEPPYVLWPQMDRDFGWIYVNVDNDLRIAPIDSITETLTAQNVTVSAPVSVSVTATPSLLTFVSGEPEGTFQLCTYEAAVAPVYRDEATFCTFKYSHSSAIAPNNVFRPTATLSWEVTATGDITVVDPVSSATENLAVAEIQALVIATD